MNHYVKGREFWEWVGYQSTTGNREIPKEDAELWAKHIRESIPEIEAQISALIEAIEKYLKQTSLSLGLVTHNRAASMNIALSGFCVAMNPTWSKLVLGNKLAAIRAPTR